MLGFKFRRQQVILGFIVDFYCHEARLAVEVDGKSHDMSKEYDSERDHLLTMNDVYVIRVSNEDVLLKIGTVIEAVSSALAVRTGLI